MRKALKTLDGQRLTFTATIERFGSKNGFKGPLPTVLLTDVKIEGTDEMVTDHVWFTKGKSWDKCKEGALVCFDARVTVYTKGYKGRNENIRMENPTAKDYRLDRPTKVKMLV